MKIYANDKISEQVEVLNLNNGEFIRRCISANQETGEYEVYLEENGQLKENFPTEIKKGNIVLVYKG